MTALPASGYLSSNERTDQQMKDALEAQRNFIAEGIGGQAASALTISGGSIEPTSARHTVDTESAASIDTLSNIALTNLPDGRLLMLEAADASRLVIVEHLAGGDGEIELISESNIKLQNRSRLILERSDAKWRQVVETQLPGGATGSYGDFACDEDEIPPRAILCFGQTIDAEENPELAARCPGLVSEGDILVPDRRERVTVGKNSDASPSSRIDSGYLDTSTAGNTGGADEVTLSASQTPVTEHVHAGGDMLAADHLHFVSGGVSVANDTHDHDYTRYIQLQSAGGAGATQYWRQTQDVDTSNDTHNHGASFAVNSAGSGALAVAGNSAPASASASAPVGLLQPSIVATPVIWG